MRFLAQDIEMMENEQRTYLANPQRHYVEINPAIVALQRVIIRQYEQFMQKSNESPSQRNRNSENSISLSEAIAARKTELNQEQPIG